MGVIIQLCSMEWTAIKSDGVNVAVVSLQREDAGDGVVGCVGLDNGWE